MAEHELRLPELGENIEAATIGGVLVAVGDTVEVDQAVVEVETDKATAEIPTEVGGVVREIRVAVGDEVSVGATLLVLDEAGSPPSAETAETAPPATEEVTSPPPTASEPQPPADHPAPPAPSTVAPSPAGERVPAAPHVRRLARELGVDIATVRGTGPGGRISRDDVKAHVRTGSPGTPAVAAGQTDLPDFTPWTPVRREPMSTIRRKTAENLSRAWTTIPHVTNCDEADVRALEELRRDLKPQAEERGVKLTITAMILRVVGSGLRAFPNFNASVDMNRREIVTKEAVHVGVAVDTPRGLLVPVVRNADRRSILEIAKELTDLSERARSGKLSIDEMRGGGFTVSNLGGLGTTHFTPIINWPEVAILGVGRAVDRLVPGPDGPQARRMLPLSLSYDHRVIDGADAARFLRWLATTLEQPMTMLLDG